MVVVMLGGVVLREWDVGGVLGVLLGIWFSKYTPVHGYLVLFLKVWMHLHLIYSHPVSWLLGLAIY